MRSFIQLLEIMNSESSTQQGNGLFTVLGVALFAKKKQKNEQVPMILTKKYLASLTGNIDFKSISSEGRLVMLEVLAQGMMLDHKVDDDECEFITHISHLFDLSKDDKKEYQRFLRHKYGAKFEFMEIINYRSFKKEMREKIVNYDQLKKSS